MTDASDKKRRGAVRLEVYFPPELAAAVDARAGRRGRNALITGAVAASLGVPLTPAQIAPRLGRRRKPTDGQATPGPG